MSAEKNKTLFRRLIEEANKGNFDAIWDTIAPDCVIVDETGKVFTKDGYRQRLNEVLAAFPDYHLVIEDLITDEDKVVARYTESATMKGSIMGMEATGKQFTCPAIEIWRFSDGKVTGLWMARDLLTQSMQIGIIPEVA